MEAIKHLEGMRNLFEPGFVKTLVDFPQILNEDLKPEFLNIPGIQDAKKLLGEKFNLTQGLAWCWLVGWLVG